MTLEPCPDLTIVCAVDEVFCDGNFADRRFAHEERTCDATVVEDFKAGLKANSPEWRQDPLASSDTGRSSRGASGDHRGRHLIDLFI